MTDYLFMAWRGADWDDTIWFSRLVDGSLPDTGTWTAQSPVPGVGTAGAPALAGFRGQLFMAWRGLGDDQTLWFSSFDGTTWAPQQGVPGASSSSGAALAVYRNHLHMVWKGRADDQGIYHALYNGNEWSGIWNSEQDRAVGATSAVPALAVYQDRLHMVWKGIRGDDGIYHAVFDGMQWSTQDRIPGNVGSIEGPALANYNGRLHMAWRDITEAARLFHTTFDGTTWADPLEAVPTGAWPGALSSPVVSGWGPSLATYNGILYMSWRGGQTSPGEIDDQAIYWKVFVLDQWSTAKHIAPDRASYRTPVLGVFSGNIVQIPIVVRDFRAIATQRLGFRI